MGESHQVKRTASYVPVSHELIHDVNPDHCYYVGASSFRVASYYAHAVGAPRATILSRGEQTLGLGPGAHVLYVNDDAGLHDHELVNRVRILEAMGVEVDWLGGEPTEYARGGRSRWSGRGRRPGGPPLETYRPGWIPESGWQGGIPVDHSQLQRDYVGILDSRLRDRWGEDGAEL